MSISFKWVDGAGNEFNVATATQRKLTGFGGMGAAPVEYYWQNKPYDHGSTYKGYRHGNRTVNLVVMNCAATEGTAWKHAGTYYDRFNPDLPADRERSSHPACFV